MNQQHHEEGVTKYSAYHATQPSPQKPPYLSSKQVGNEPIYEDDVSEKRFDH